MPTYQYMCTQCGEGLEVQQSFTEDSLTVCPACDGRLRKVFNAVGVVFKGSGFYRNDSREKSSSGAATTGSESSGESGKSGGTSETSSGGSDKQSSGPSTSATSGGSDGSSSSSNGTSATTKSDKRPTASPASTG